MEREKGIQDRAVNNMIDLGTLIEARDSISCLSKLEFSLYDGVGNLLASPHAKDDITEAFASSDDGKEEQERFVANGIRKAILRRNPSVLRGPMNQYHFFIPALTGEKEILLVGNGFYTSVKDLNEFVVRKGMELRISKYDVAVLMKKVIPRDIDKLTELCQNVQRLFALIVRDNCRKNAAIKKYRRLVTAVELLADIDKNGNEESLYRLFSEAIMFLFGGDTVSILGRTHDAFMPVIAAGRFKDHVASLPPCSGDIGLADTFKRHRPFVCTDALELRRLRYPDTIVSLYIFPLSLHDEIFGLLSVFNARFSEEEIGTISRLCSVAAFQLSTIVTQKMLGTHVNGLTAMRVALNLKPGVQNTDTLYQSIVEVSSKLVSAERVSLMLPEATNKELSIKAVKGMNRSIAKNIRVAVGGGIAGRVFVEGKPLMVSDIERNLSTQKRPSYKTGAFLSIPLKIGDESIGVLNLADKADSEVFSEADMVFLDYFASYASMAIKGAQYYQKSEEMRTLSITDSLTGLFNRRYFDERLFEELQRAGRYDSAVSLAMLDIDSFKVFNDTEGHLAGDEVLKEVAEISRESIRSIDIIARCGGEEFCIIMPQTDREEAFLVAERVRINIRELVPRIWKNFPHERLTVSIGIVRFPTDGTDAKTLIKNMDKALYRAKIQGKDRTVIWKETTGPFERP